MNKNYNQKLLDSAKKSATDVLKTASKRAIQKTAEATGDLTGNNMADKITSTLKKLPSKALYSKELHSKELHSNEANSEITKEKYISPQERQQIMMN